MARSAPAARHPSSSALGDRDAGVPLDIATLADVQLLMLDTTVRAGAQEPPAARAAEGAATGSPEERQAEHEAAPDDAADGMVVRIKPGELDNEPERNERRDESQTPTK
jgi:hypothetical protein